MTTAFRRPAVLLLLAVLGALLTGTVPARAQQPAPTGVFTVTSVPVDATAQSAAQARDQARLDGQRRAFRILLERLTLAADRSRLPRVGDAQIQELVRDFEVANERRSAVRYLADYTFRFQPEGVRNLLQGAGIPFTETMSKRVTVVPVLVADAGPLLWDDPNPWREAWAARRSYGGLVPVQVPLGDAADVAALDAQKALAGDPQGIAEMSRLHGGGDVLVATARRGGAGELVLGARRLAPEGGAVDITQTTFRPTQGESDKDFYGRAVEQVVADLEEAWKKETIVPAGQEGELVASVPLQGLDDWIFVRQRLAGLSQVKSARLRSLDRRAAMVELRYVGDAGRLRIALAQRDLDLRQSGTGWTLQRRSAAATPAAPAAATQ